MILDALLHLSSAQAFSATGYTTNTIDLSSVTPKRDIAIGEPMALVYYVTTGADYTTTDETYEFQFVQSANANLSSQDVLSSRIVSAASSGLAAGTKVVLPLGPGSITKQYIGGRLVLGGTTPSITVTAYIQPLSSVETYKAMNDGITIS